MYDRTTCCKLEDPEDLREFLLDTAVEEVENVALCSEATGCLELLWLYCIDTA